MCSRRSHLQRCPLDGKRRFRDKREAIAALHGAVTVRRRIEAEGRNCGRQERRAYACGLCRGWHLTSQEAHAGLREPPGLVTVKIT